MTLLWVLMGVGIGVAATVVYLTNRSIVPPILKMVGAMGQLAGGDHAVEIPATDKKDEIGLMARAVLIFKENMIKAKELAAKEAEAISARVARAARVNDLTQTSMRTFDRAEVGGLGLDRTAGHRIVDDGDGRGNQQPGDGGRGCDRRGIDERADRCGGVGGTGEFRHRNRPAGRAIGGDRPESRLGGRAHQYDRAGAVQGRRRHRRRRQADQRNRQPDQPARAQRHDRGGARRRGGQGICGGGGRGQEPRRTNREGHRSDQCPGLLDPGFIERSRQRHQGNLDDDQRNQRDCLRDCGSCGRTGLGDPGDCPQRAAGGAWHRRDRSNVAGVQQAAGDTGAAAHQVLQASSELSRQSETMRGHVETFLSSIKAA